MNFANMKMRSRLGLSFVMILMLLVAVATTGYVGMNKSNNALHHVVDINVKKTRLLNDMSDAVYIVARVVRTVALMHDEKEADIQKGKIKEARELYNVAFATLEQMPLTEAGKSLIVKIRDEAAESRAINDKFLILAKSDLPAAIELLLKESIPATARWQESLAQYIDLQRTINQHDEDDATAAFQTSLNFMLILTAVAIIFGSLISWLITRSLLGELGGEPHIAVAIVKRISDDDLSFDIDTKPNDSSSLLFAMKQMRNNLAQIVKDVRSGTELMASTSGQIAAGNLDLSSRTEQQAASLEETASSMEELTSTVKQNFDNSKQANQLATTASEVAVKGGAVVAQVVDTMGAINESARKIVDIIGVIDGIAFQTNILALNAAVEAARAGEQGRGFAVVATEVRNLAQRSAAAAKEIKYLIGDSVEKVDAGSKLVNHAGETMGEIVESVKRVTDIITEITAASKEQTIGIEQINQAIMQMDDVTQQNAALVEESAAAAVSLQGQADKLVETVQLFTLDSNLEATVAMPEPALRNSASQLSTANTNKEAKPANRMIPLAPIGRRIGNSPVGKHEYRN